MESYETEDWQIIERLNTYQNEKVTSALYDLGWRLLDEAIARTERIESKGRGLAGFTGAVLALLVSSFTLWKTEAQHSRGIAIVMLLSVIFLILAGIFAFSVLQTRTYHWLDQKDGWFAAEYFGEPEQLKKYYLLAVHRAVNSHETINASKAERLSKAECLAFVGGINIAVGLAVLLARLALF